MPRPTPAQVRYLENAQLVMDAGWGRDNAFRIWGPGLERTGEACLRRGWIVQIATGTIGEGFYFLTTDGRNALRDAQPWKRYNASTRT